MFFPCAGYIGDPQLATHNVQRAAEAKGAEFRFNAEVTEIRRENGRVAGITLRGGERIDAGVVVNVAGPHSYKINRMAGVEDGMTIKTRALKQEVAHVPFPAGFDFERMGLVTSDSDIGCYCRPEIGNHLLIGSEDPPCDVREWVDPDDFDRNFSEQWQVQVQRVAQRIPSLPVTSPVRGRGRPVRRHRRLDPDLRHLRPARLLHGGRHQRQSVQERAGGRRHDGRADQRLRAGPRP